MEELRDDAVRCPTCGAEQAWSNECRRCKCDLSLLHQAAQTCWHARQACLTHLRDGDPAAALPFARRYFTLSPDARAARLLSVCYLLNGHDAAAWSLARIARNHPRPQ